MNGTGCRIIVCLTTLGLIFPYGIPADAANLVESGNAAVQVPVVDVALADGILRGQLVDGQGAPRSHTVVTISSSGDRVLQRTTTNEVGFFSVRLDRAGIYVVSAGDSSSVIRAWSRPAAPPSAKDSLLLVSSQNIERGNLGDRRILVDPRLRVGLAVAAIGGIAAAIVVAVNDSGS